MSIFCNIFHMEINLFIAISYAYFCLDMNYLQFFRILFRFFLQLLVTRMPLSHGIIALLKKLYNTSSMNRVDKKTFRCKICLKTFSSKFTLSRHFKVHDIRKKRHKCSSCASSYASKESLKNHERTHNVRYTCLFCNKLYSCKPSYERHMLQNHTINPSKAKNLVEHQPLF